jgi:hypothetical protein
MRASSLGNRDLHLPVEPLAQLVERADVVAVTVGEGDAPDRRACLLRRSEQGVSALRDSRVYQREAVVLPHEIRVHEAQPRELDECPRELTNAHGRRNLRSSPAEEVRNK